MLRISEVMKHAVDLEPLNDGLYSELYDWGTFIACPINWDMISNGSYMCAVLRDNVGMYSGFAAFHTDGIFACLLHVEILVELRGKDLGKALFLRAVELLKSEGITEINAADPAEEQKAAYLNHLGFGVDKESVCMEYKYNTIIKTALYRKKEKLKPFTSYVQTGTEVTDNLKKDFLEKLINNKCAISSKLLVSRESLFFVKNDLIYAYLGIRTDEKGRLMVLEDGYLKKKSEGIDVRVALFSGLMENLERRDSDEKNKGFLILTENPVTMRGLKILFGNPDMVYDVKTYSYGKDVHS